MTVAFVIAAAVMAALALAWVVMPLLRPRDAAVVERERTNLAILRDQRRELERDLANGTVTSDQYDAAAAELDRRVLEETQASGPAPVAAPARSGKLTAAVIGVGLPVVAAALYMLFGTPAALSPEFAQRQAQAADQGAGDHATNAQQIEAMIERVKERLASDPGNLEAWVVLARTYYVTGRANEAISAFDHAVKLAPNDADLLADYADALGVVQGRSLQGKPAEIVERALKANPGHWKANALAGTIAFENKQYAKAVGYWEKTKASVPPGSPMAQSIEGSIAEARQLGGLPAATPSSAPTVVAGAPAAPSADVPTATAKPGPGAPVAAAPVPTQRPVPAAATGAGATGASKVSGTVSVSASLASGLSPEDAVFIFARPADGSRMPLALTRTFVKNLPFAFTLDDSMAMAPTSKLSDHAQVIVGARVSRSGSPMPQPGDLEGLSQPVKLGSGGVSLVIDKKLP